MVDLNALDWLLITESYVALAFGLAYRSAPTRTKAERAYLAATTVLVALAAATVAVDKPLAALAWATMAWLYAVELAPLVGPTLYPAPRRRGRDLAAEVLWRLVEVWPRPLDGPHRDDKEARNESDGPDPPWHNERTGRRER